MTKIKTASGLKLAPVITAPRVRILTPGATPNSNMPRIWHAWGSQHGELCVGPGHTTPRRTIS